MSMEDDGHNSLLTMIDSTMMMLFDECIGVIAAANERATPYVGLRYKTPQNTRCRSLARFHPGHHSRRTC
eukprot:scaffold7985_cov108-Skeletonema_dohrnii-CCMP3373.AAC.3